MTNGDLLSIGGVAASVGRSPALLRIMEQEGGDPACAALGR